MVTLMYKNAHTQNKNSAKQKQNKKQTNTSPPIKKTKKKNKNKTFRVLIESVTGCKDSIPIFLFEEKRGGSDSVVWQPLSHRSNTSKMGSR